MTPKERKAAAYDGRCVRRRARRPERLTVNRHLLILSLTSVFGLSAIGGTVSIDTGGASAVVPSIPGTTPVALAPPILVATSNRNTTPPALISNVPFNGAKGVGAGNILAATFSEPMNPSTINASTFSLMRGIAVVSGAVTYAGTVATFSPLSDLVSGAEYTARITTGAESLAGNALNHDYSWSFTASSSWKAPK